MGTADERDPLALALALALALGLELELDVVLPELVGFGKNNTANSVLSLLSKNLVGRVT